MEAIRDLNETLERAPDVYQVRGGHFLKIREWEKAESDLEPLIRLERENARNYHLRGVAKEGQRQYEHAIEDFDAAIKLDDTKHVALLSRGQSLEALGPTEEALREKTNFSLRICSLSRCIWN